MASHRDDYQEWPYVNEEEFELACAYFDQKYVKASLGPTRQIFKIRQRRILTTNNSYLEILRLLQLPEDDKDLLDAFSRMGGGLISERDTEMAAAELADQETLHPADCEYPNRPPPYSIYSQQPYVTYEIHYHPTYRVPTLWFMLHDLPMGEAAFDLEAVYRYLVPAEYKAAMRAVGVIGAISAAPHPVTDVPAFFIHPCQTPDALKSFDCPLKDYILIWLGLVGGSVGLSVPLVMAEQD